MAYPTTASLVAASSVTELTSLVEAQQDSLRASAIAAVEEFCGQSFDAIDQTLTIDGQGSNALWLPERLAELSALTVNYNAWSTENVIVSKRRDRIHIRLGAGLGYYEQALSEVSGEHFRVGLGNVQIEGTWGWLDDEFPEAIGVAIQYDMEDTARSDANLLTPTITSFRKLGIRSIDQGNLRADLSGQPGLTPRVVALLTPYVWHGEIGALV